jgi:hypothetical protein
MVLRSRNSSEMELMELYGVKLFHEEDTQPKLGSWIQMELRDGLRPYLQEVKSDAEGKLSSQYQPLRDTARPSIRRLGYHFGFMHPLQDLSTDLIRRSRGTIEGKDLPEALIKALETKCVRDFFQKVIEPAREDVQLLRQPFYLYCVPALIQEPDLLTGKTIERRGTPILALLPKTVHVAKFYQVDEAILPDMAKEVVWVVKRLVTNRVIQTSEQLIEALDRWPEYVESQIMQKVMQDIQHDYPHLITPQAVRALLPSPVVTEEDSKQEQ